MAYVDNKSLREVFLASELTACGLAKSLGYMRLDKGRESGDESRVRYALGLKGRNRKGKRQAQRFMQESTALRYAEILGLDPHELGL